VAKEFRVLPSVAARAIDRDPMHFNLACLHLIRYAEAKQAFDKGKSPKAIEAWKGSEVMAAVKINTAALKSERLKARAAARAAERKSKAAARQRR
jgi:hypothetical protein